MEITLPLDRMTTEEKIRTMETLWDDLCKKAENIPAPSWHKEILDERENGIKNGKYEFMDWDEARKKILNSIK